MDELADLKKRFARIKLLYDVSNTIHSSLDPQEALRLIVGEAVRLTQANSGSVARHGQPARVGDVLKDARYVSLRRDLVERRWDGHERLRYTRLKR